MPHKQKSKAKKEQKNLAEKKVGREKDKGKAKKATNDRKWQPIPPPKAQTVTVSPTFDLARKQSVSLVELEELQREQELQNINKQKNVDMNPLQKIIEEIESEGSSSEISEDLGQYYYRKREMLSEEEEEQPEDQLDNILDMTKLQTEIEPSSESSEEDIKQTELEEAADFFGNLGDFPSVDDLSEDIAQDIADKERYAFTSSKYGYFVDPLTGAIINAKRAEEKARAKAEEEELRAKAEAELSQASSEEIQFMDDDEDITKPQVDEEDFQFLNFELPKPADMQDEIDAEARAREEAARQNALIIELVLNDLINKCVDRAEYVDANTILRQNLDKPRLMTELRNILVALEIEKRAKHFLNQKCVEYYRRKKQFRPILDDKAKVLRLEKTKYFHAVNNLDAWLLKEQQITSVAEETKANLRESLLEEHTKTSLKVRELEDMIRSTLKREHFDKLEMTVNNSLQKMSSIRNEISNVRFKLILQEHMAAKLKQDLFQVEDLGNGLSMRDYESMQTETQALDVKVEERNADLNKLRQRCHSEIHSLAHVKENQKMLQKTITVQLEYLQKLSEDKKNLREFIYRQKLLRSSLRREVEETSADGGLLDKPILMHDYDQTMDGIEKMTKTVDAIKSEIQNLNRKIVAVEKGCASKL